MTPRVTVVGIGPAGPDLVTAETRDAIDAHPPHARFLRTARHPSATAVPGAVTFDHLYESSATFPEVYAGIADALVEAAEEHGSVLYAVPGSPRVLERSVDLLLADERVVVTVLPALSFLDLAWDRLGIDPVEVGVRLVDGHRFAVDAAGERGPLLVAHCHNQRVLSDVKLAYELDPPSTAVVLQRLGLRDESVGEIAWAELDRAVEVDHLTALYIARGAPPVAAEVARFAELVATLRRECPWDREQTHASLTRHLLEEAYEVLEAIDSLARGGDEQAVGAAYDHLEEELGDLLFQVVFHATLAREAGVFTLADVARRVHDKLVGRHPHVFGDVHAATAGQVLSNWEELKKAEKGRDSVMDGIPDSLPALLLAAKVQRKAASLGIDAPASVTPPGSDVDPAAIGDALFALVAVARTHGVDPELALRATATAFRDRVRATETSGLRPPQPSVGT